MNDIILGTRSKLESNAYRNEQHVRISFVTPIRQALGWDVTNPEESYTGKKPKGKEQKA